MCLFTKHRRPKIAREDILIHKLLDIRGRSLVTPTIGMKVTNNILKPKESSIMDILDNFVFGEYEITEGWIHAFAGKDDSPISNEGRISINGIIPKGTLYYEGIGGEVAAKKIILDKKIFDTIMEELK